ncbi:Hypothetical predicted protein [Olea europaea subsp. europaea]|uniref:Uncharacterized protein n=1 Tax=Olea europaea subsp. europaea TaxID=158383 RepID=A0A8S0SAZ1_OLEEU|nr:Hypothetical predicted protein [Olea europaea subsp. europaea]
MMACVRHFRSWRTSLQTMKGATRAIKDWIKSQAAELRSSRSSSGSNVLSQPTTHLQRQCTNSKNTVSVSVLDPKSSNRKDAPRKLRRKSPLESTSKKAKATSTKCKGKRPALGRADMEEDASVLQESEQLQYSQPTPFSYSQLLFGDVGSQVFTQQLPSSTNVIFNSQATSSPCFDQVKVYFVFYALWVKHLK